MAMFIAWNKPELSGNKNFKLDALATLLCEKNT